MHYAGVFAIIYGMNRCKSCGRLIGLKEHKCKPAWNKGLKGCYKLSEETKAKIGAWGKGRKHSEETKRKIGEKHKGNKWNLGNKHSEETLAKMRANNKRATKGKPSWNRGTRGVYFRTQEQKNKVSGKNNPNWRGGISGLNLRIRATYKYYNWRFDVFKRDKFTCVWCGDKKPLNVDHIKAFSVILRENKIKSLRQAEKCIELWDLDNGRTLCIPCHKKTDTYGRPKL